MPRPRPTSPVRASWSDSSRWIAEKPFPPAADPSVVTVETLRFPGYYLDAHGKADAEHNSVRLVKADPHNAAMHKWQTDPWALFKLHRMSVDGLVAVEALRFPGYYVDVYAGVGADKRFKWLRLVKSSPTIGDKWGVLRTTSHGMAGGVDVD